MCICYLFVYLSGICQVAGLEIHNVVWVLCLVHCHSWVSVFPLLMKMERVYRPEQKDFACQSYVFAYLLPHSYDL